MLCKVKGGSFSDARVNEDAFGYDQDCAWVLDGSTGLNGKRLVAEADGSDAQWYATAFSDFLKKNLSGSTQPLPELFSRGVETVWAEFLSRAGGSVEKADVPCALGTAVRIKDGFLEYINVGDCVLFVRFRDGSVAELLDDTLCKLDEGSINLGLKIAKQENAPIPQCRPKLLQQLRSVRMRMNAPDGYISLADNEKSVLDAKNGKFPLEQIRDICMVSDGFYQYYHLFHLVDDAKSFIEAAASEAPQVLFNHLLEAQKADAYCWNYPRLKLSDDATILYACLE